MSRGPGPVLAVHRIFILTALAGTIVFALWELREFARDGGPGALVGAVAAAAAAAGIAIYLRGLRRLRARLTPGGERRDGPARGRSGRDARS